ncbi:MAG: YdeI/OmpD-associated family protein [Planctomycetales bacterium]|nr:YdeI/OmpD-associated family protein [Planctomycetales bacterium]
MARKTSKHTSPEVDAYIANAAPFAKPILKRIRRLFHAACPEIRETIKWSVPHFEYKGVVGMMAAFKQHASYGFWKAKLMRDPQRLFDPAGNTGMGGTRVTSEADLPVDKVLVAYIAEAVALNEAGETIPRPKRSATKKETVVPDDLLAALAKNKKARVAFEAFSYSHKKEYVEWINEAKQEATRQRRLATTIEWLAEGKSRNWKYKNC